MTLTMLKEQVEKQVDEQLVFTTLDQQYPQSIWWSAVPPPPETAEADLLDVLYVLNRAKMRMRKHGWVQGTASDHRGICLGTALGLFDISGKEGVRFADPSKGAQQAIHLVDAHLRRQNMGGIAPFNDLIAKKYGDVERVLDEVIEATLEQLARSA